MASYVEQAVLQLQDKTTAPARKINAELNKLYNTVDKLSRAASAFKLQPASTATINSYKRLATQIDALQKAQGRVRSSGNKNMGPTAQEATRTTNLARAMTALATAQRGMPRNGLRINIPLVPQNRIDRINQLTAALRAYARVARGMPQNQTLGPRVNNRTGSGGMGGNTGGNSYFGGMGGGGGRWTLMDTMIHSFAIDLQNAVRRAIINGVKEGYRARDIADTRLSDLNLSDSQKKTAESTAVELIQRYPVLNKGDALQLYSENIPVAKGNEEGARQLTFALAEYIRTMVTRGENKHNAVESAISIAKAGEQAGILMDNDGNFDIENARKFFETVNKGFLLLGKEGNARFLQDLMRNLQGAKYSINDEGLITAMLLGEDMGASRTGTGINQAIRQLSGERIQKKQLGRLIEMGLLQPGLAPAGMVGDKSFMELIGGSATDETGLRTNFFKWINDILIPKMEEKGFDPTDPVHAAKFAGAISSDRTSVNMIVAAIVRAMDIRKTLEFSEGLDTSSDKFDDTASRSGILALQEFTSQTESLLGSIANSLESTFIPALRSVSTAMQSLAGYFENKTFSNTELAVGAAGIGGLAYGAAQMGGWGLRNMIGGALSMSATTVYLNAATVVGGMGGVGGGAAGNAATTAGAFGVFGTIVKAASIAAAVYTVVELVKPYVQEVAKTTGMEKYGMLIGAIELKEIFSVSLNRLFQKNKVEDPAATNLATQIAELTTKISLAKEKEAFPGANEMLIIGLENERRLLEEQTVNLGSVFSTGATQLSAIGPTIESAASAFGPTAGAGLLGVAQQFGQTAGASFLSAAGKVSLDVNVNQEATSLTGRTPPLN